LTLGVPSIDAACAAVEATRSGRVVQPPRPSEDGGHLVTAVRPSRDPRKGICLQRMARTTSECTATVTARPNKAPAAALTAPASVAEGSPAQLDASGSTDEDGSLATYAWDLDGDGSYDDATGATATVTPPAS
jgi:hypothetical protein